MAEAELGEVGEVDIGQVDHDRMAGGVDALNRQGHQDRVVVILLDRLVERCAGGGLVVNVPAQKLNPVADPLEDQNPFVLEVQGLARHGQAARDHDRGEQGLVELVGADLGVKVVVLLMEREQAVVPLRSLGQVVEILVFLLIGAGAPAEVGRGPRRLRSRLVVRARGNGRFLGFLRLDWPLLPSRTRSQSQRQ